MMQRECDVIVIVKPCIYPSGEAEAGETFCVLLAAPGPESRADRRPALIELMFSLEKEDAKDSKSGEK